MTILTLKVAQAPSHTLLCCVWRAARGRGTFIPGLCYPFAAHSVISAKNNLKRRQRRLLNTHAAALSLPDPVSRMLPKYSPMCLGHNQRLSAKEEVQEFLKRVGKFTAGDVRLMECDASVTISPETRGNGHCRGSKGILGQPGPVLVLPCCFCSSISASYHGQLVHFTTSCIFHFQEQLLYTSSCRPRSPVCLRWECLQDPCAG